MNSREKMRKPIGFLILCPMETRIYHAPDAVSGVPPTASAQKNAKSTSTNPSVASQNQWQKPWELRPK